MPVVVGWQRADVKVTADTTRSRSHWLAGPGSSPEMTTRAFPRIARSRSSLPARGRSVS